MSPVVRIDDLVFSAVATPGDRWICNDLQGWYSSPPMRADTDDRPVADGAFGSVKNYRSARALAFSGYVLSSSYGAAAEELLDAFASVQADGTPIILSVENENGLRSLTVSLSGVAEVKPHPWLVAAELTANFVAYDPIKYGPTKVTSSGLPSAGGGLVYPLESPSGALSYGTLGNLGRVSLVNNGTADVFPAFQVTGQLDAGFFLQCLETGETLRYDRVVPLGTTVGLDARTESTTIDGVAGGGSFLTRFEWFRVPAKTTRTVQFNSIGTSAGTPTMTAMVADGYW